MIAELRLWRTWPALFRLLVLPVLRVWLHPCRTLRQVRELDECLRVMIRAFAGHLEAEHPDDWPGPERHLSVVK